MKIAIAGTCHVGLSNTLPLVQGLKSTFVYFNGLPREAA
jgi:hypothetical protein